MPTKDLATRPISAPENEHAVRASAAGASASDSQGGDGPVLNHGDFVGRYSVLAYLGRGGMGVVYKAYDPQLDRNVAIKLLRRGRSSVEADVRLLHEAQTLARLKHPNVVAVYDVGLASHGLFIAMELLEGQTLNEWLDQRVRSLREVLEVFHAAGRGLVAAHEAGFIHRDFKPGNLFIDDDGSVKVLDFGLAHAVGEEDVSRRWLPSVSAHAAEPLGTDPSGRGLVPSSSSGDEATDELAEGDEQEDGGQEEHELLMGTPAYMAPEEFRGRTDHRSEQFAFCMSLYVALFDRPPLAGETFAERQGSLEAGLTINERALERAASGERVPPRVRRAIIRGLATDPADRFPSMERLLAELEEPPRRWPQALAGATLLVGFGVGAVVFDEPQADPCSDPVAALEDTWGVADRSALEAAFGRGKNPSLDDSLGRVEGTLDAYAAEWVTMYEQSCRSTFVEHQQSESLFDTRMRCLQRRRNRLRATIDALTTAEDDDTLVQQTILPYKLPPIADCDDEDVLAAEQPLPDEPELRDRVAKLRARLDRADTAHDGGAFSEGIEVAEEVVREARELDYVPVLAEGLSTLGRLQASGAGAEDAEATLGEAVMLASQIGDDRTEAAAWVSLLFTVIRQRRVEEGLLGLAAKAAVERAKDPKLEGWLLNNQGVFLAERGEVESALAAFHDAIEVKARHLGTQHVDVGVSWANLGNALADQERYAEAREALDHAREIFESTVSAAHPMTIYVLSGMCRLELAQGEPGDAVTLCRDVLERFETVEASPMWQSKTGFNLAQALWKTGVHQEAREVARRAQAQAEDPLVDEMIEQWLVDPDAPLALAVDEEAADSTGTVESETGDSSGS